MKAATIRSHIEFIRHLICKVLYAKSWEDSVTGMRRALGAAGVR
jgi:hypothetical protein